jgi:transposase
MGFCAGVDWGGSEHAVCVLDDTNGAVAAQFTIAHTSSGLADLIGQFARFGAASALWVALERPSGILVEALLAAGHQVIPVHPNMVKATRSRYRASGGKSDRGDAYVLADLLRTDRHRFQPLRPCADAINALRVMVRGRDALVAERVALTNRLTALLDSFWAGAATLFAAIDSPIALAFLRRFPTPASANRLGEARMTAFLKRQRYSGRRSAAELLAHLDAAPKGHAGAAEMAAKGKLVGALVALTKTLIKQIADLTERIEQAIANLPDGRIIMSFPRAGRLCAAQILVELGDVRERFATADQLAAEAGVSPVTRQSGKSRGVMFRRACNRHLRQAITCFAHNSRQASTWAARMYNQARARGCDHPHALRILSRAWIRVIWKAWIDHKPYALELHTAAQQDRPDRVSQGRVEAVGKWPAEATAKSLA